MNILLLVTEGAESMGGIAQFNQNLIEAISENPQVKKLTTLNLRQCEYHILFLLKLWRLLRKNNFDLILCGHLHLAPYVRLLGKKIPKKILILHGIEAWKKSRHAFVNQTIPIFEKFISVSVFTQQQFLQWAPVNAAELLLLPNCVDLHKFQPGPRPTHLANKYNLINKVVLVTLARLDARHRYKGIDEILELLPTMIKKNHSLRYLVLGDGSDRQRLEHKCQTLGIRHLVEFAGNIAESEKAEHLRLGDVFVMPGYGEGFGIAYLEAIACGIPAIGSKLDGSREALLNGKLGLLVNPNHPSEIQTAIGKALKFPKATRPVGIEFYSKENFSVRVSEILKTL